MANIEDKINSPVHSITEKARIFETSFKGQQAPETTFKKDI